MSRWRQQADTVIAAAIKAGQAAGDAPAALRKRVDAAYPFGERRYLPYKHWLAARCDAFAMHGLLTDGERRRLQRLSNQPKRFAAAIVAARESGLIR